MAKNIQLLLTESVDNLGIVGDVVTVRTGYARNFLMPRQLATTPSEELVRSLGAKRAEAERQLAELRKARSETVTKLAGFELSIERSCNDLGVLYAAVTQQEIVKLLGDKGFHLRPRDVRLPHAIKRVDHYDVHIKFEADLEAVIKLNIIPDRKIESEQKPEMDFDVEGNLIEPGSKGAVERERRGAGPDGGMRKKRSFDLIPEEETVVKGWKVEKRIRGEDTGKPVAADAEKPGKSEKGAKGGKGEKKKGKGKE